MQMCNMRLELATITARANEVWLCPVAEYFLSGAELTP